MMYPNFSYRTNRFIHSIYEIFLHFLPAYLYDWLMRSQGMTPIMMKIAKRYKAAADTGEFFAMHEWDFEVNNVNELLTEISACDDQHEFNCDVKRLDWDTYLKNYVFGIRKHILKDDLSSMDSARKMIKRCATTATFHVLIFVNFAAFLQIVHHQMDTANYFLCADRIHHL